MSKERILELEREIRALRVEMSHVRDNAVRFELEAKEAKLTLRDQFALAALTGLCASGREFDFATVWTIAEGMLGTRK